MLPIQEIEGIPLNTYAGKAANACRTKLRGIFGDSGYVLLYLTDMIMFMQLHDKFASKGYFITKENKENMYIQILETGDTSLFEDLEKYIDYLDKMSALTAKVDEYNDIIAQLKLTDPENQDAVNSIVKDYLTK